MIFFAGQNQAHAALGTADNSSRWDLVIDLDSRAASGTRNFVLGHGRTTLDQKKKG
jgi:hypothetical protein